MYIKSRVLCEWSVCSFGQTENKHRYEGPNHLSGLPHALRGSHQVSPVYLLAGSRHFAGTGLQLFIVLALCCV